MAKTTETTITFSKSYSYEGKEYESVDLSGIENLTGDDLLAADKVFAETGGFAPAPELTLPYAFAIASASANLPLEFFGGLPAKDALKVKNTVVRFLNN
ncbi:phage tail assembly protein [Domibacillus aminovorans]|uniref:phage tail assembly protein n=1 Tax=Domibacillus aminovorans TaxID=29332 RepID=UPI003D1F1BD6